MAKPKNSWEEVRKIRCDFTRDDVDDYPYYSGLNHTWETLCETVYAGEPFGQTDPIVRRDSDELTAKTPLGAFQYYMDIGIYPPPELLVWLSNTFTDYYQGMGKLELEEVFFGKPKPALGNAASRKSKESLFRSFSMEISFEGLSAKHQKRKRLSMQALAVNLFKKRGEIISMIEEEALGHVAITDGFPDVETFLRNWRRWKKRNADT
jgi:hypothetical protein